MDKSPDAFRTISEVAEALETPAHVLRFWESRFPQIKPVKRAGGRRYYRPVDVALLAGIRHLLHDQGMTIRGVQKILREQGVRHVAALVPSGDLTEFDAMEDDYLALDLSVSGEVPVSVREPGQVVPIDLGVRRISTAAAVPGEIVHLHAPVDMPSDLQTVDPDVTAADLAAPDQPDQPDPDMMSGFPLPTANRRPLPTLDPDMHDDDLPEAGHVWVEDDDPTDTVATLFPVEAGTRDLDDLDLSDAALAEIEEPVYDAEPQLAEADAGMVEPLFAVQAEARRLEELDDAWAEEHAAERDADPDAEEGHTDDLIPQAVQQDLPDPEFAPQTLVPMGHAGVAARLRALPRPISREVVGQLGEVQMRLGLLQAQMIEAARVRR